MARVGIWVHGEQCGHRQKEVLRRGRRHGLGDAGTQS